MWLVPHVQNMSSFWPSSTSEYRFLGTKANYWFVFIWFFNSAPQHWARNLLWAKFRVVEALIRTGKQTQKSEARGEEYKTSGMYWRVLDDEEAAAYKWRLESLV